MPPDPMRALDDVTPPDLWDEITARAADGDIPVDRREGRRRPLLVAAAAVVVLAAVAGGLVLANRSGEDPGVTAEQPFEEPIGIWGREWDLIGLVVDGERTEVPPIGTGTDSRRPAGSAIYLDLTTEGRFAFTGCNTLAASARVEDDRLVAEGGLSTTFALCADEGGDDFGGYGEALMALDQTMTDLFLGGPEVLLDGNELTLSAGDTSARFFDADARPRTPEVETALLPSGDSDCALDVSQGPVDGWTLTAGPAVTPQIEEWDEITGVRSGLWTVTDGERTAEIQIPGQMVIDLVGERTGEVVLDEWGPATIWYRQQDVQVRVFPGLADAGPCDSFTVTVAGPEAVARIFAVDVANAVITAER